MLLSRAGCTGSAAEDARSDRTQTAHSEKDIMMLNLCYFLSRPVFVRRNLGLPPQIYAAATLGSAALLYSANQPHAISNRIASASRKRTQRVTPPCAIPLRELPLPPLPLPLPPCCIHRSHVKNHDGRAKPPFEFFKKAPLKNSSV
jgi:hypothetical protein